MNDILYEIVRNKKNYSKFLIGANAISVLYLIIKYKRIKKKLNQQQQDLDELYSWIMGLKETTPTNYDNYYDGGVVLYRGKEK